MSRVSASSSLPRLVLASTSQHRRQLLERFGIRFTVAAPDADESPLPGETPVDLVARLARAKAEAVAHRHRSSVVIGSDQVAVFGRQIIGKPGNPERAIEQLQTFSGQSVTFHTAVHLVHSDTGSNEGHLDVTTVHFRKLSQEEIERYVARERPVSSAGSFKVESLGISLFDRVETQDPTALIGLPLIWVAAALRRAGFQVP